MLIVCFPFPFLNFEFARAALRLTVVARLFLEV